MLYSMIGSLHRKEFTSMRIYIDENFFRSHDVILRMFFIWPIANRLPNFQLLPAQV